MQINTVGGKIISALIWFEFHWTEFHFAGVRGSV